MRWPLLAVAIYVVSCLVVLALSLFGAITFSALMVFAFPWGPLLLTGFGTGVLIGTLYFLFGMAANIAVFLAFMRLLRQV